VSSGAAATPIEFTGGSQLGELGQFLVRLHQDATLQAQWCSPNRGAVIDGSGLSQSTKDFLHGNPDVSQVQQRLQQETGPGNQTWICIWIRR